MTPTQNYVGGRLSGGDPLRSLLIRRIYRFKSGLLTQMLPRSPNTVGRAVRAELYEEIPESLIFSEIFEVIIGLISPGCFI